MSDPRFEWDKRKASENKRKQGITFEEAMSAFLYENARVVPDPDQ